MNIPLARTVRKLKQAISGRLPSAPRRQRPDHPRVAAHRRRRRRPGRLAVVLVQNVVSETSEQIAGSSARKTAAKVAASTLVEDAKAATVTDFKPTGGTPAVTDAEAYVAWDNYYTEKCNRIKIIYNDAGVEIVAAFAGPTTATTAFTAAILATATAATAPAIPQASCSVT